MNTNKQQSEHSSFSTLLSEENLFRNFVNNSRDVIFLVSSANTIVFASPACLDIFGYTPADFLEIPNLVETMVHPDYRIQYDAFWNEYRANNIFPDAQLEWAWVRKDGKTVYTENSFVNLKDSNGKTIGFQTVARDITKRKLAEKRNQAFINLGAKLSSAVTVDETARIIADVSDTLFSWDAFTFDLYLQEQHRIVSILNIDTIEGNRAHVPPRITNTEPTPRMKQVIEEGAMLILHSPKNLHESDSIMFGDTTRISESVMLVPIRTAESTLGIVSVQSYTTNFYDPESLTVLQSLADHCRGALERIRTREELRSSEEKFRGLFEHVPDGVYQSTKEGRFIAVNKALSQILGYGSVEELLNVDIGRDLYNSPEERNQFIQQLEWNSAFHNVELHWRKKDGTPIVLLENAHVVRDSVGKTLYYEGTLTDITEIKQIEQALKKSEHKYRILVERMNEGVLQVDNNDIIQFANDRYCEIVGYSLEELIGRCAYELLHDEQGQLLVKEKNRLRRKGISDSYEIPLRKKTGERITMLISGSPIYDDRGVVIGSIGINLDITERKKAEEELAKQKHFLRQVIDLDPNFIFAKDRQGRFTLINQAVADAYGTTVENLVGKTDADFNAIKEEVEHFLNDDIEVMDTRKEKFIPEEPITDASGNVRWLQTIKRPILSPDGKANQVLGVSSDITARKKADEAFRQSELRFRKIFEEGPIGMAIVGADFNVIDVNSALCRMLGYTHAELLNIPIASMTHPDDLEKDFHLAAKAFRREIQSYTLEKRYIRKDKSIIWGRLTGSVVWDLNGNALYGIGMVEDITERKRTEEMLRLLESAVQQANEAITITDADLNLPGPTIVFVNPAFTKMTGYSADEVIGKTPRILQGKKTDRAVLDRLRYQLERGEEFHGEIINYKKDGTEFFLEWHVAPIKNDLGAITHFLAVQRDITSRKTSEESLRKSEKRYRLFFEEDLTGDYISLLDGTIIECNPAFERIFGFTDRNEAFKYNAKKLFPTDDSFSNFVERVRNEKKLVYDEMELVRTDGARVNVIQNVIGIFGKEGELRRFKGYLFDNTERKKLEMQLLHSQKMESIGTLAAGLAHNFNNIMSIILGYATSLKTGSASPSKVADSVAAISLAVKRGTGLVRQLTTFARSSEPILMSVNLNALIQEIERMVRETFPETITCAVAMHHDSASILADPNQMHQALLNLCLNARDAMPEGGILTMKTSIISGDALQEKYPEANANRYVCIAVSDTGIGFDPMTREHIFEPFFTTKEIGKGTGLGLSVVYGIVKNHKGFIDVTSELNNGATFSLYFEAQPGVEKFIEEEQADLGEVQGGNETLLIVEDEEMLLELVKSLLELKGYSVLIAKDGEEALELLRKNSAGISLILTDMGLPKVGGWDLLRYALEINPRIKVILASGYLDSELRQRMIDSGAADFIQKPYEPDFILSKIREVLDQ
ncbi:MAG: PAS domain S-box protein [Bacteroidetes bacterium]|nr:MAG: PAS domain S-box protein [Bacteroidota bacterium]